MTKAFRLLIGLAIFATAVGAGCRGAQQAVTNKASNSTTPANKSAATSVSTSNNASVKAAQESLDEFTAVSGGVTDALNQDTSALDSATNNLSNE